MPVYRKLEEFPDYRFGSDGSIFRLKKTPMGKVIWHEVNQTLDDQYYFVRLQRPDKTWTQRAVNRLICRAFRGEPPTPEHQARHYNGNSVDNRAKNLLWGTRIENMRDAQRHGTIIRGSKSNLAKLTEQQVYEIKNYAYVNYGCSAFLADKYGVSQRTIQAILAGKAWAHVSHDKSKRKDVRKITIKRTEAYESRKEWEAL